MFVQLNITSVGQLPRKYVFCFINKFIISDNLYLHLFVTPIGSNIFKNLELVVRHCSIIHYVSFKSHFIVLIAGMALLQIVISI